MNNLLLYIRALQCNSINQLLRNAWVEGDTVYVFDSDYGEAVWDLDCVEHFNATTIIDSIIHNRFKCQYFKIGDIPNSNIYYWDEYKGFYNFDKMSLLS